MTPPKNANMHPTLDETLRSWFRTILDRLGDFPAGNLYQRVMDEVELALLEEVLCRTNGSRTKASKILGIHRNTLRMRIEKLGIKE